MNLYGFKHIEDPKKFIDASILKSLDISILDLNSPLEISFEEKNFNGLSDSSVAYLQECIDGGRPDVLVDRIDEINFDVPPKAIDSDPRIADIIAPVKDQIDSKYLEAPSDVEQVKQISEGMTEIYGVRYEEWEKLTPSERVEVLQQVENVAAEIAHRPACEVRGLCLDEGVFGYYNPKDNSITVNTTYLKGDFEWYKESLNTIIHEGRHAYQQYNIDCRQVHQSEGDCQNWRENLRNDLWGLCPENYGYQSAEEVGPLRYWMQPVEADARAFAADVLNQLDKKA